MKELSIYIKTGNIIEDARQIIERARSNAVRSVDFCRVQMRCIGTWGNESWKKNRKEKKGLITEHTS